MQNNCFLLKLLLITLCVIPGSVFSGELRFASENIDVALFPPDTVEVTGEYFFTSSDGLTCSQRVLYPFPADSAAKEPCYVSVKKNGATEVHSFRMAENGISFAVDVPKGDTVAITVVYRQCFTGRTGRYILTTTSYWGRPLLNSNYSLRVPLTVTLKYLYYECDTVYVSGDDLIYSFYKKKFMPDRDFIFTW